MKKKIWIFNHYAGNMFFNKGGRHYWFAKELKKQGYEPVIFCCNINHGNGQKFFNTSNLWEEHATDTGIPFVFIRSTLYKGNGFSRIINMKVFAQNLIKTCKQYKKLHGKPDIILASSVHPLTVWAGEIIAKLFKVPCIAEFRDLWPESIVAFNLASKKNPIIKFLYLFEHYLYYRANQIVFTMEGGKNYIIERHWNKTQDKPINLEKVHYINNGLDIEDYQFNKENSIYKDLDLDNSENFNIVYTGSIRSANGLDLLLDCAKKLEKYNNIKFILFGEGEDLNKLLEKCYINSSDNVIFKGSVNKKYIPNILSKGDVNLLFYNDNISQIFKYGSSQNKLFEYLASGKPTISNNKINYSIIDRTHAGISLDSFTIEKMTDLILYLYKMPKTMRETYGKNGIEAVQEYDFINLTRILIKIIEAAEYK